MKKIFDFEASNIFEELLSNIIKEQLNLDGFKVNQKQIQKVQKLKSILFKFLKNFNFFFN